jgi:ElaB/YqjD/DUF883 family membrane-anchored ribosome-binding protein
MAQTKLNVVDDTMENQIAELRSQIATLTESFSTRASAFSDDASDVMEDAKGRVSRAAQAAREQGHNVVEAVKENPGAATSLLATVGALGFALGYFLATNSNGGGNLTSRWR